MADRYRKVRKAMRDLEAHKLEIAGLNRVARRQDMTQGKGHDLRMKIKEAKRGVLGLSKAGS